MRPMPESVKVLVRGFTVELAADDPRAQTIVEMLFAPPEPPAQPPAPPEPPPPLAALRFWDDLHPLDRRELLLLTERPLLSDELESALADQPGGLLGGHLRVSKTARRYGVDVRIRARGRGRRQRRYFLDDEAKALVKRLAGLPPPC